MGENIFLIGYMGVGKTTLAKSLSHILGYQHCDIDEVIEERIEMKITEIFAAKGESHFRELEKNVLNSLLPATKTVFAAGGGLPCHNNLMEVLNQNGITVYLKADPEQIAERLMGQTANRPLLKDIQAHEMLQAVIRRLEEREPIYNQSKLIFPINLRESVEGQTSKLVELLLTVAL